jgi:hypothetical protein
MSTYVKHKLDDKKIVLELPTGTLSVEIEETLIDPHELFGFAARANPKRGFLFMSKVLGKHYPTSPKLMRHIHNLLAQQIPKKCSSPVVFIAMAETAIGLGQGVFEQFRLMNPNIEALFLHSTRYHIPDFELVEFEEAHSHAPRQFLHLPKDADLVNLFMSARSIVLIDDEASTGNTFVNLVNSCRLLNPQIENVHLSVITNFMGAKNSENDYLTDRFGLSTSLGCMLTGSYTFAKCDYSIIAEESQSFSSSKVNGATTLFGRCGLARSLSPSSEFVSVLSSRLNPSDKILLVGTGEFMHFPFLLGCDLEERGFNVVVQSSTRSPILKWGDISEKLSFPDNYNEGITNFLYNVSPGQYDKIVICHETPVNDQLIAFADILGANLLQITESEIEQNSLC